MSRMFLPHEKLHPRDIYASGGGAPVAPINVPPLFQYVRYVIVRPSIRRLHVALQNVRLSVCLSVPCALVTRKQTVSESLNLLYSVPVATVTGVAVFTPKC